MLNTGSGEFYLMQQGSDDVKLVVRTINSSAFTQHDWDEYVVDVSYVALFPYITRVSRGLHRPCHVKEAL